MVLQPGFQGCDVLLRLTQCLMHGVQIGLYCREAVPSPVGERQRPDGVRGLRPRFHDFLRRRTTSADG